MVISVYWNGAYNVTKTLSEDASKNRLTLFYTKAETGQSASDENGQSDGTGTDDGTGNGNGSGNGDADGNGSGNGTGTSAGNGSGTAAGSTDGQTIADADSPAAEPEDTMDLDEGDVPLDDDEQDAAGETGNSSLVKWAIICIVIAVIAFVAALVIRSKRRNA